MADLTISTPGAVVPANANTTIVRGTAGATITAGQTLYADSTSNYSLKPAANTNASTAAVVGVALNAASTGQPVDYAAAGDVTFEASLFTTGTVYILGLAAGKISMAADIDITSNTRYATILGVSTSATNLRLGIVASGVLNP
ncbi:MAG: hypothetical protein ABI947_14490 [Chloroflexota bacterium]